MPYRVVTAHDLEMYAADSGHSVKKYRGIEYGLNMLEAQGFTLMHTYQQAFFKGEVFIFHKRPHAAPTI